jgi:hypothetical protein
VGNDTGFFYPVFVDVSTVVAAPVNAAVAFVTAAACFSHSSCYSRYRCIFAFILKGAVDPVLIWMRMV